MSDFPKWMLALAGVNLLPVVLSMFYLFGATPFGTSESSFIRFLLYVLTQMLWLVPLLLFFFSLDLYRRGYERIGITLASIGCLITITGTILLFL